MACARRDGRSSAAELRGRSLQKRALNQDLPVPPRPCSSERAIPSANPWEIKKRGAMASAENESVLLLPPAPGFATPAAQREQGWLRRGRWLRCPPCHGDVLAGTAPMGSRSGAMLKGLRASSGGAGGGLPAASPALVAMVKSVVYSRGVSPGRLLSKKACFIRKKKKKCPDPSLQVFLINPCTSRLYCCATSGK